MSTIIDDTGGPCGTPARRKALLGDVASSGVMIDCDQITEFVHHNNVTYRYCGVSDGIAYYLSVEELKRLEDEAAHRECVGWLPDEDT